MEINLKKRTGEKMKTVIVKVLIKKCFAAVLIQDFKILKYMKFYMGADGVF